MGKTVIAQRGNSDPASQKNCTASHQRMAQTARWTLALLTFVEDPTETTRPECAPHSLALKIDMGRSLFTNYSSFVQAITNQGSPCNSLFAEPYITLE